MNKRSDTHRPSVLDPSEYRFVLCFAYGAGFEHPAYNIDRLVELKRTEKFFAKEDGQGGCDICGARFIYGCVFKHEPTGEHIITGHICGDKVELLADPIAWNKMLAEVKAASLQHRERRQRWAQYRTVLGAHPELRRLFKVDHDIVRDIRERFRKSPFRCVPTANQIALLAKLEQQVAEKKAQPVEAKVPAPVSDKRVKIEGTVVSRKLHESQFGRAWKLTVKVETEKGVWLCWGTEPSDAAVERGDKVRFEARLVISDRDQSFAFFKRPTKFAVVADKDGNEVAKLSPCFKCLENGVRENFAETCQWHSTAAVQEHSRRAAAEVTKEIVRLERILDEAVDRGEAAEQTSPLCDQILKLIDVRKQFEQEAA